ncbi:MAG: hypothetical protein KJ006_00840 [Thermoleophilia bacterium]|nr:hypothetical protein [Thermoleophilia bacterium]GIK78525.1 MAG: hypothetical protein BroJett022_22150 [Actinomycetes bacterium]
MDRDAGDVAVEKLDLAGVDAAPELDAELAHAGGDRARAAHRARRAVERGEEPVAGRLDRPAAMLADQLAGDPVVAGEELAPLRISERLGPLGRADDVGEGDRGEGAGGIRAAVRSGDEFRDRPDQGLRTVTKHHRVAAGQLEKPGTGNVLGEIERVAIVEIRRCGPVDDERRYLDLGEDLADVEQLAELPVASYLPRRSRLPQVAVSEANGSWFLRGEDGRMHVREEISPARVRQQRFDQSRPTLDGAHRPLVSLRPGGPGLTMEQDQVGDAPGVSGGGKSRSCR